MDFKGERDFSAYIHELYRDKIFNIFLVCFFFVEQPKNNVQIITIINIERLWNSFFNIIITAILVTDSRKCAVA